MFVEWVFAVAGGVALLVGGWLLTPIVAAALGRWDRTDARIVEATYRTRLDADAGVQRSWALELEVPTAAGTCRTTVRLHAHVVAGLSGVDLDPPELGYGITTVFGLMDRVPAERVEMQARAGQLVGRTIVVATPRTVRPFRRSIVVVEPSAWLHQAAAGLIVLGAGALVLVGAIAGALLGA